MCAPEIVLSLLDVVPVPEGHSKLAVETERTVYQYETEDEEDHHSVGPETTLAPTWSPRPAVTAAWPLSTTTSAQEDQSGILLNGPA